MAHDLPMVGGCEHAHGLGSALLVSQELVAAAAAGATHVAVASGASPGLAARLVARAIREIWPLGGQSSPQFYDIASGENFDTLETHVAVSKGEASIVENADLALPVAQSHVIDAMAEVACRGEAPILESEDSAFPVAQSHFIDAKAEAACGDEASTLENDDLAFPVAQSHFIDAKAEAACGGEASILESEDPAFLVAQSHFIDAKAEAACWGEASIPENDDLAFPVAQAHFFDAKAEVTWRGEPSVLENGDLALSVAQSHFIDAQAEPVRRGEASILENGDDLAFPVAQSHFVDAKAWSARRGEAPILESDDLAFPVVQSHFIDAKEWLVKQESDAVARPARGRRRGRKPASLLSDASTAASTTVLEVAQLPRPPESRADAVVSSGASSAPATIRAATAWRLMRLDSPLWQLQATVDELYAKFVPLLQQGYSEVDGVVLVEVEFVRQSLLACMDDQPVFDEHWNAILEDMCLQAALDDPGAL